MPGFEAFVSAKDIVGENDAFNLIPGTEEIFSSGRILYAGQAIGLVLADSYEHAQ